MRMRTQLTKEHTINELIETGYADDIKFQIGLIEREIDYRETIQDNDVIDTLEEYIMILQMELTRRANQA